MVPGQVTIINKFHQTGPKCTTDINEEEQTTNIRL